MRVFTLSLAIMSTVFAGYAMAGDIAAGQKKAAGCLGCHGANGVAVIPGYPSLKGQNEQYLVSSMQAYKNKQRKGGLANMMQAQMSILSNDDIENLAAYFASLK
ncbi:c-type cytochrome [Vibrio nitrifigilis]|uniref:Cytochrome c n=1 Tax=Vibrio nitrifigilis TaxID=2789781 RepID=A0ABS0GAF7_9VIBR|nr:cytochrome c [Vibrio nitrifigilis]MBF8999398.1 cytochrome c [Vibrio nitrifigilis]